MPADLLVAQTFRNKLDDFTLARSQELDPGRVLDLSGVMIEKRFRNDTGKIGMMPRQRFDRCDELVFRRRFTDDTPRARAQRRGDDEIILTAGEKAYFCFWTLLADAPRRLHAVHAWHGAIDDGDIRRGLCGGIHDLVAVGRLGNDLPSRVAFQNGPKALPHQSMIVGDQNTNHGSPLPARSSVHRRQGFARNPSTNSLSLMRQSRDQMIWHHLHVLNWTKDLWLRHALSSYDLAIWPPASLRAVRWRMSSFSLGKLASSKDGALLF